MARGGLKRWLKKQGCRFVEGKRQTKVLLKGRATLIPRHAAVEMMTVEMKTGRVEGILKALGLKGE